MANSQIDSTTISRIADIFKREYEIDRLTGRKFNIFKLAGIEYDEVKICLVLSNLLDPNGTHCQGSFFLEKFCRKVLNFDSTELPEDELKRARVIKEYSINKTKRRIDIVIITSGHFIPIEVKINANDEDRQCFDYYEEVQKQAGENAVVFYLTPDGKTPSKESSLDLSITDKYGKGKIRCISFKDDISDFLSECISDRRIISFPRVCEVLVQFLDTVKRISGCDNSSQLTEKITEIIPKKINLCLLSEEMKKDFLRETMKRFLQRENLPKNDSAIIEEKHDWKYRLSEDIGKTSKGESISILITVDVYEKNAYWGITLETCRGKPYDDTLMKKYSKVKKIIDNKIGEDYGRINTWIFKQERTKLFDTENVDFYRLLIKDEFSALIDEVVYYVDGIFRNYCSINEVN